MPRYLIRHQKKKNNNNTKKKFLDKPKDMKAVLLVAVFMGTTWGT
jgi:hypothetical protein